MARTIAQQIDCSLDSISSFHLMAPRLYKDLDQNQIINPFWIKDFLPRRGLIAGIYQLIKFHKESNFHEFSEIISPQLIHPYDLLHWIQDNLEFAYKKVFSFQLIFLKIYLSQIPRLLRYHH